MNSTQPKNPKDKRDQLFSDKAYLLIKGMILSLKLSPKEILSESKLAKMLGMSRTPVREALKKLMSEGIITSYDKKGYFIKIPSLKEFKDIYELRAIVEGSSAKLAAQSINLSDLESFERKFKQYKANLEKRSGGKTPGSNATGGLNKGNDFIKLGRKFHFFIIESTQNTKIRELVKSIYEQLEISRVFTYGRRRKEAADEHLKIIEALKERNGEKSKRYMEEHLKNAFEMLTRIL